MYEVILDLETQRAFSESGKYDPRKYRSAFGAGVSRSYTDNNRNGGPMVCLWGHR